MVDREDVRMNKTLQHQWGHSLAQALRMADDHRKGRERYKKQRKNKIKSSKQARRKNR
jgi:hypothetical protein